MSDARTEMSDPGYVPTVAEAMADPVGFVAGMTETVTHHQVAAHTPGPWREWDRREHAGGILITDATGYIGVCRVIERQGRSQDETADTRVLYQGLCGANAQLIAAAPDLLAACLYIRDMLAQTFPSPIDGERETMAARLAAVGGAYAETLVTNAIRKATGSV
jgi:hypothetical protein